ncbi:MAG: MoaD/ThiS family protein [Candidatus Eremiobacteraeota bacterium]|nr:MoaD/ThiS family protein [Candidatus Eremiobacteraeota bacterium]MBV9232694.1 MoaD/ThiS family protein [Candidatus Eremiobacteraeota bacterium]
MRVRVLAFARLRELLQAPETWFDLPHDAGVDDLWLELERRFPLLHGEAKWVRVACNGRLVDGVQPLREGDEIALLPPVGGG